MKTAEALFSVLASAVCLTSAAADLPSLQERLDARKNDYAQHAPPETVALFERGVEEIRVAGITQHALTVGDEAPDFELPSARGEPVRLSDKLKAGPVVLLWYRGGWCPYCNLQLKAMQAALPAFQELGAAVLAVSPETTDHAARTAEKTSAAFDLLSDAENRMARQYGLVYTMNAEVAAKIGEFVHLAEYNGNDRNEFPLAAAYVLSKDGIIRFAFVDADYRRRAEPADLLEAVRKLAAP